jgi:hypothetical protein
MLSIENSILTQSEIAKARNKFRKDLIDWQRNHFTLCPLLKPYINAVDPKVPELEKLLREHLGLTSSVLDSEKDKHMVRSMTSAKKLKYLMLIQISRKTMFLDSLRIMSFSSSYRQTRSMQRTNIDLHVELS